MSNESYRQALDDARTEMTRLIQQRAELDARLTQLKSTVDVLSALLNEPPKLGPDDLGEGRDAVGVSEAIRQVLTKADTALTPNQIKSLLTESGFDLAGYANPGAVIYNTLKRLVRQQEVDQINDPSGAFAYKLRKPWIDDLADAVAMGVAAMGEASTDTITSPPAPNSLAAMYPQRTKKSQSRS